MKKQKKMRRGLHLPLSKGTGPLPSQLSGKKKNAKVLPRLVRDHEVLPFMDRQGEKRLWQKFQNPWDELAIHSKIMIREDYIKRLKAECLPLAREELVAEPTKEILPLVDLLREITVQIVENIAIYHFKERTTFLFEGRNYLLEIPSSLDFAQHLPELCIFLKVNTLKRNPFILLEPLPRPRDHNDKMVTTHIDDPRLENAINIILNEEMKHGVKPCESGISLWKDLDDAVKREHKAQEKSNIIKTRMVPKLAKVIICDHNMHCFRRNDRDGDGMLFYREFIKAVETMRYFQFQDEDEKDWLLQQVDSERAGWISYKAFHQVCKWAQKELQWMKTPETNTSNRVSEKGNSNQQQRQDENDRKENEETIRSEYMERIRVVQRRRNKLKAELGSVVEELRQNETEQEHDIERKLDHDAMTMPYTERMENGKARPHIEYAAENMKRMEHLIGDLSRWKMELMEAIETLTAEEKNLQHEMDCQIDAIIWTRQIKQNQVEEKLMRQQEEAECFRVRSVLMEQLAREREERQKLEKRYREEQRRLRKERAREQRRKQKQAAVTIQLAFRCFKAKTKVSWKRQRAENNMEILSKAVYFLKDDQRLSMRTWPVLIITNINKVDDALSTDLQDIMRGNFWHDITIPSSGLIDLGALLDKAFAKAPGVILRLPFHMLAWKIAIQCALQNTCFAVRPLCIAHCSSIGETKWEEFSVCPLKTALTAIHSNLMRREEVEIDGIVLEALQLFRPDIDFTGSMWWMKLLESTKQNQVSNDHLENLTMLIKHRGEWPRHSTYISHPIQSMLMDWMLIKSNLSLPIQSPSNASVDLDLSKTKPTRCVDVIVQVSLNEMRVFNFQGKLSAYRYGPSHILLRQISSKKKACYRLITCRELATWLVATNATGEKPHELMRQLILKSRSYQSSSFTFDFQQILLKEKKWSERELINNNALLHCGYHNDFVISINPSTQKSRIQYKLYSTRSTHFDETRGSLLADKSITKSASVSQSVISEILDHFSKNKS